MYLNLGGYFILINTFHLIHVKYFLEIDKNLKMIYEKNELNHTCYNDETCLKYLNECYSYRCFIHITCLG